MKYSLFRLMIVFAFFGVMVMVYFKCNCYDKNYLNVQYFLEKIKKEIVKHWKFIVFSMGYFLLLFIELIAKNCNFYELIIIRFPILDCNIFKDIYCIVINNINKVDFKTIALSPIFATILAQVIQFYFAKQTIKIFGVETYPYLQKYFTSVVIYALFFMLFLGAVLEAKIALIYASFFILMFIVYLFLEKSYLDAIKGIISDEIQEDMNRKVKINGYTLEFEKEWRSKFDEFYSNESKLVENLVLHILESKNVDKIEKNETLNYVVSILQANYDVDIKEGRYNFRYIYYLRKIIFALLKSEELDYNMVESISLKIVDFLVKGNDYWNVAIILIIIFSICQNTTIENANKSRELIKTVLLYSSMEKEIEDSFKQMDCLILKNCIYITLFWQLNSGKDAKIMLDILNPYILNIESYPIKNEEDYCNIKRICFSILFIVLDLPRDFLITKFNRYFSIGINYISNDFADSYQRFLDDT